MEVLDNPREIYFDQFVKLCETIGRVSLTHSKTSPANIFDSFLKSYGGGSTLAPGTGIALFRLLFPEEDFRRKFGLKDVRLSGLLIKVLQNSGIGGSSAELLGRLPTSNVPTVTAGQCCLGDRLRNILQKRNPDGHTRGITLTIREVDTLLTELSKKCEYTQAIYSDTHGRSRSQLDILLELYGSLEASRAAVITQVILKDLNPILYPIGIINTTRNLLSNNTPPAKLSLMQSLAAWDSLLPRIYHIHSSIEEAFEFLEDRDMLSLAPKVGIPIMIPKCYKGRSCKDALKPLSSASHVYCETKYDGERMQIHIDLLLESSKQITIFSKSKRDSTMDRYGTLGIIRAALRLPDLGLAPAACLTDESTKCHTAQFSRSLIIEAEMVTYSEKKKEIDEFWRIRSLISRTAKSCRSKVDPPRSQRLANTSRAEYDSSEEEEEESQQPMVYSLESDGSDGGDRHFMLVFFDVLHIDGRNLLNEEYHVRRSILDKVVRKISGYSTLAERTLLNMKRQDPIRELQGILSRSISRYEEGLVLKAQNSKYNSYSLPWVKLKKDYIPGLGDCVDMAVIGASYDQKRGEELRVGEDTFTTFHVAALSQPPEGSNKPHFEWLFTVEYGISREHLEQLNFDIKYHSPYSSDDKGLRKLPYTVNLPAKLQGPSVVFKEPMLFEVYGASFDKPQGSKYYALRFPRVSKIYRPAERSWREGETIESFTKKAYAAVGRDSFSKQTTIAVAGMWKISPGTSPEARSVVRQGERQAKYLGLMRGESFISPEHQEPDKHGKNHQPKVDIERSPLELLAATNVTKRISIPSTFPDPLEMLNTAVVNHDYDSDTPRKRPRLGAASKQTQKPKPSLENTNVVGSVSPGSGFSNDRTTQSNEPQTRDANSIGNNNTSIAPSNATTPTLEGFRGSIKTNSTIPATLLLEKTFSLIYRPLYPPPTRPRNRPSVRSILPAARLVNTFDALLAAVGWAHRGTPVSSDVKCGIIFVESYDADRVVGNLEAYKRGLGTRLEELPEIFVVLKTYLDIYVESSERAMDLRVLWRSH